MNGATKFIVGVLDRDRSSLSVQPCVNSHIPFARVTKRHKIPWDFYDRPKGPSRASFRDGAHRAARFFATSPFPHTHDVRQVVHRDLRLHLRPGVVLPGHRRHGRALRRGQPHRLRHPYVLDPRPLFLDSTFTRHHTRRAPRACAAATREPSLSAGTDRSTLAGRRDDDARLVRALETARPMMVRMQQRRRWQRRSSASARGCRVIKHRAKNPKRP